MDHFMATGKNLMGGEFAQYTAPTAFKTCWNKYVFIKNFDAFSGVVNFAANIYSKRFDRRVFKGINLVRRKMFIEERNATSQLLLAKDASYIHALRANMQAWRCTHVCSHSQVCLRMQQSLVTNNT